MAALLTRRSLPYQMAERALSSIDRAMLLRLLVGLSGTVNGGVLRTHSFARTLVLSGSQRLSNLHLQASRRLRLPLDLSQVLATSPSLFQSAEELALARAMLELYLGLLLQFLAKEAARILPIAHNAPPIWLPKIASYLFYVPSHFLPKARSNPPEPRGAAATS